MRLPIGKVPPELLTSIVYPHLGTRRADVLVHAQWGEDCAVIDFGEEVAVLTTDPITGAGPDLGWYAVFVATNDLAAAGAEPVALALTLLLAPDRPTDDLTQVMRDASAAAQQLGVEIAGGHSEVTSGIDRTIVVATAMGRARKDQVLRSGGAQPGDALLLTKGAGIEGTAILAGALEDRLASALGPALVERAKAFRHQISVLPEARGGGRGPRGRCTMSRKAASWARPTRWRPRPGSASGSMPPVSRSCPRRPPSAAICGPIRSS